MRVAVIQDWLVPLHGLSGAERVLEQILLCYPGADVFTTVDFLPAQQRHILNGSSVFTSFLQRMPLVRKHYWSYLPLMPMALEQFDLSGYDLVISNSHTVAKGVVTGPEQVHVCYIMSPMRFAWDLHAQYLRDFRMQRGPKGLLARLLLHYLRTWDQGAAARVDAFVAVSHFIARRTEVCYRREAEVLYPPVDVDFYSPGPQAEREDYYLAVSRMVPFKRMDLIVEAFAEMPSRRLVVVGDGPEAARVRAKAGPNTIFLGYRCSEEVRDLLRGARAFVFAAPEDFGLVMVEAQGCGTPVLALGRGGAKEIVQGLDAGEPTGVFFAEQSVRAIRTAVEQFEREAHRISAAACRKNALRFAADRFRAGLLHAVERAVRRYRSWEPGTDSVPPARHPMRLPSHGSVSEFAAPDP